MSNFGSRLAAHLKSIGLTQWRLARSMDIAETTMSKLCNGALKPSNNYLVRMASVRELKLPYELLRYWRMLDEYTRAEISHIFSDPDFQSELKRNTMPFEKPVENVPDHLKKVDWKPLPAKPTKKGKPKK